MNIWFQLGWREIKNNSRFSLFFIINLAIGLVGFIALNSFNASIQSHLERNAKALLSADLSIQSKHPLTNQERELIDAMIAPLESTHQIEFVSMAASGKRSRLSQILAVDQGFPLYGHIELNNRGKADALLVEQELLEQNAIWVYPDLLTRLNLEVGDNLKLGKKEFHIKGTIARDPSVGFATFGVASRIYMGINHVKATKLIQFGSQANYRYFYRLPAHIDPEQLAKELREEFGRMKGNISMLRVITPQSASDRVGRALKYLNHYLGLVSLVALFLAGLGAAYLFRDYVQSRLKEIAILMSLGARRQSTYWLLIAQIFILGAIAALVSTALSLFILPWLPELAKDFLPPGYIQEVTLSSLGVALFTGVLGSLIFCIPILVRIRHLQPLILLQQSNPSPSSGANKWFQLISYLPGFLVYWGLAVWLSNWVIGSLFVSLFVIALIILSCIAWQLFKLCGRLASGRSAVFKIALRSLDRNRLAAISCFLSIALGTLLINLIPQIQQGIQNELNRPEATNVPTFFLINIQQEQLEDLTTFVQKQGYRLENVSPSIRGRIVKLNEQVYSGQARFDVDPGEKRERHRRNFAYSLSYFKDSQPMNTIVEGPPIQNRYDFESGGRAEVSVAQEFALRMGISIGDHITFDVMGIPIESKVINLRQPDWGSFQPNFIFMFQPGVFDDAPKTFFASIASVDLAEKNTLQGTLVHQFPNITMIDITRILERVLEIIDQVSLALTVMAYLSIFAGLVVVYSIARHEVQNRLWEMNLLKILGAQFQTVRRVILIEFGILSLSSALLGVLLSLIVSYIISSVVFESLWTFYWQVSLFTISAVVLLSLFTAVLATQKILQQKPLFLLRSV